MYDELDELGDFYMSFERPNSWYELDSNDASINSGWVHENDLPDILNMKDFLLGVIEAVYVTGDVQSLETCLDELCSELKMKLPSSNPVLEMKKSDNLPNQLFNLGVALSRAQHASQQ